MTTSTQNSSKSKNSAAPKKFVQHPFECVRSNLIHPVLQVSNDDDGNENGGLSIIAVSPDKNAFIFDWVNCLEGLDELQWHLNDVDLSDSDRRVLEGFLEGLTKEVATMISRDNRKPKPSKLKTFRKFVQRIPKMIGKKAQKELTKFAKLKFFTKKGRAAGTIWIHPDPDDDPMLPFVIHVPSASFSAVDDDPATDGDIANRPQDDVYYLQDAAYVCKPSPFIHSLTSSGHIEPHHKRTFTDETLPMESIWDADLYDDLHDDCFFDLNTGIVCSDWGHGSEANDLYSSLTTRKHFAKTMQNSK